MKSLYRIAWLTSVLTCLAPLTAAWGQAPRGPLPPETDMSHNGWYAEMPPALAEAKRTGNDMIIDYPPAALSPIQNVRAFLQSGYNGGDWAGNGITSASAAVDHSHAIGYGENSVLNLVTFGGVSVDSSALLLKYTFAGDSNLDGQVDVVDLGALASNWQSSGAWTCGDFDYNGAVDVNDLGLLASNWQAGVGSPLSPASLVEALTILGLPAVSVPEPGTMSLLMWSALLCHRSKVARAGRNS